MKTHQWNGHELKLFAESQADFLFCFVGMFVIVDDKYFVCSPQPKFQDLITFKFEHNGKDVVGQLRTRGLNTAFRVNYELTIDGTSMGRFHVRAGNWWIAYPTLLLFGVVIGVAIGFGVVALLNLCR